MEKILIASFLVFLSALSGITYQFLNEHSKSQDLLNNLQSKQFMPKQDLNSAWQNWQKEFGKQYSNVEAPLRFQVFSNNYNFIQYHNSKKYSFQLGLNQFADLTPEEFSALQQGSFINLKNIAPSSQKLDTQNLPAFIDWRSEGIVTNVKNQGQCGSCWAFASCAALEGLNALNGEKLQSFSPQQLIDCAGPVVGTKGCNGGNPILCFQYTSQFGIESWDVYKYQQIQNTCQYDKSKIVFKNYNYSYLENNDVKQIKIAVSIQPLVVAIEADQQIFQLYKSGVFDSSTCGSNLDHAVTLVGYGTDSQSGQEYWIVKNSWDTTWGQDGYIYIAIQEGLGICGINQFVSWPTLDHKIKNQQ